MIVLGEKYAFTKHELERLNKKRIHIKKISYKYKKADETISKIEEILVKNKIKIILLNTQARVEDEIIKYLTNLQFVSDIEIISIEKFMEKYLHKCYIPQDHTDLHYLEDIRSFNAFEYIQKRIVDLIGVSILFTISIPVILYSLFRIRKESPGSPIFTQKRVGKNGKEFTCYKFRSMHLDSYHDLYTRDNDPRIFKWGKFIRKTRIDEIPQIINVIKGDMHFIGPRAEWNILIKEYEKSIPYYNERHLVRPGITGWAQVMYPYGANAEDAKQKLMYDLYYIKHWNIWLEAKVTWMTILVVLGRSGV